MRAGSLKTLGIDRFAKPDQAVQVLEELPHCTHLSELELDLSWVSRLTLQLSDLLDSDMSDSDLLDLLWLSQSDKVSDEVRHVTFVCSASTV